LVVNMQTSVASRKTAVNVSGVLPDLVASTQAGRGGEAGR
jgi:hypothetical protein